MLGSNPARAWNFSGLISTSLHCCEDHFHLLIHSSHLWFSYIHNYLYTILRVYYESPEWPAPSWLVGSDCVALNWYRKGYGFKSRKGLNFLSPCFHHCLRGLHYYEDRFHIRRWKTVTIYTSIHFYFWKSVKKIRKLFSPRYFTWHLALGLVNIWTFQKLSVNKKKQTNKQIQKQQ